MVLRSGGGGMGVFWGESGEKNEGVLLKCGMISAFYIDMCRIYKTSLIRQVSTVLPGKHGRHGDLASKICLEICLNLSY